MRKTTLDNLYDFHQNGQVIQEVQFPITHLTELLYIFVVLYFSKIKVFVNIVEINSLVI